MVVSLVPQTSSKTPEDLFSDVFNAFQTQPRLSDICGSIRTVKPRSGLTNRVYRLETERGEFFLRLPRAETAGMVDRHAEAHNLACATDLGLALPALLCDPETGVLVTRSVEGTGEVSGDFPVQLGVILGRLHSSDIGFQGTLDADAVFLAQKRSLSVSSDHWREMQHLDRLLTAARSRALSEGSPMKVPSHGDLSPGNCLATADRLWLIDWEYSGMADPAWDLAYAILEHGFTKGQEAGFLEAYRIGGAANDCPSLEQLEIMKARCDAVSALWALEQVDNGREASTFLPFALERRDRALARLKTVS